MGTRGAIGFHAGGKDKIMYNHFNSYPSGLGVDMVTFARKIAGDLDNYRKLVNELRAVDEKEKPTPAIIKKAKRLKILELNVSGQSTDDWYCVLRGAQGDLDMTLKMGVYEDSASFLLDSLFCEYAYIINFDVNDGPVLEFYKGFNKNRKGAGRYAAAAPKTEKDPRSGKMMKVEYAGVELVGTAPIAAIPDNWKKLFFKSDEVDSLGRRK